MLDSETILKIVKAMLPPHIKVEIYAKDMPIVVKSDGDGGGGGGGGGGASGTSTPGAGGTAGAGYAGRVILEFLE